QPLQAHAPGETMTSYQIGVLGVGVMGRNLAWNIADHGYTVSAWNREPEMLDEVLAAAPGRLHGTRTLEEFIGSLERPRRVLIMITAGKPVDMVLDSLEPLLEPGDIVIEGGNSWFEDTQRREQRLTARGLHFFGVGVSGGEDGARLGPSLMPGGKAEAYPRIQPILESIAARTESGPCVTLVGPGGAGHFVKMVHNGIEYADMQFIAEAYDLLRRLGGFDAPALARTFAAWNQGPLESFLIEITGKVFTVRDPRGGGWLVDKVLDKAGQKGTGRWTAEIALRLGVSIPSIAAAIDARVLSSMKEARTAASAVLPGPAAPAPSGDREALAAAVHDALLAAKIVAYAQGMSLIRAASDQFEWGVSSQEMARIWKGGCIIRARFLDTIMRAYQRDARLDNLLLDETIRGQVDAAQVNWRKVVGLAQNAGIPVPAMAASLAYYDSYRTASLPQNLTQAQRDAFGAHTYQRSDAPEEGFVHTDWI
ncbi:MAG TPA: NADP-dependent phosphogluconate dehydrogenase, partial [Kofleriaceae bacterium]|nr:NADP-dependent phosphogluconate dehydrogenase [Kofleriaceae bacterium]